MRETVVCFIRELLLHRLPHKHTQSDWEWSDKGAVCNCCMAPLFKSCTFSCIVFVDQSLLSLKMLSVILKKKKKSCFLREKKSSSGVLSA